MDKRHLLPISVIAIIALVVIVFVSSGLLQDNTNKNPNQLDVGSKETFSVSINGGHHSALDDIVEIDVQAGSVLEQVNITVESINNPVEDTTLHMFSCFEFGPDGFVFEEPIDLIIHYNPDEIPEEVEESDVKIYLLNSGVWEPIVGSFANENMDYAVASVSHFSKMGCGASPATSSSDEPTGNDGSDDEDDGSAQYWFKADLNYYSIKTPRLVDWDDDDMYSVGVSAHWKPVSYVQYYEIKFVFNGNLPEDFGWGCDFREQSKSYCYPGPYPLNEDTGKMESVVYGNGWPLGDDGYSFLGVNTVVSDDEELSANAIGSIVSQMETFVHQYVNGWEVWVRGVTETQ